jgi:hypothetical protein
MFAQRRSTRNAAPHCTGQRNALESANVQGQSRLLSASSVQGDEKAEDATLVLQNRCHRQVGTTSIFGIFLKCFRPRAFFS